MVGAELEAGEAAEEAEAEEEAAEEEEEEVVKELPSITRVTSNVSPARWNAGALTAKISITGDFIHFISFWTPAPSLGPDCKHTHTHTHIGIEKGNSNININMMMRLWRHSQVG